MSDYVNIQHGDLDDAAAVSVALGHDNLADYVGFGLDINVDYTPSPPQLSLSNGKVFVLVPNQTAPGAGHEKHDCLMVAHYDARQGLELPYDENYIWAQFNVGTNDSPYIEITNSSTRTTDDSVLIGEVNVVEEDVTPLNRYPDGEYDVLTSSEFVVNEAITWPDGVTTDTHPLTYGETIDNPNDYYDVTAQDPEGTVANAENAANADQADTAANADYADLAGNAENLNGNTSSEIIQTAVDEAQGEWTPLLNEPYVKDNFNRGPDVRFNLEEHDYDYYKMRLVAENYETYRTGIGLNVNDITQRCYHYINLLPADEFGNQVTWRSGTDTFTVGDCMPRTHCIQDLYVGLPDPVKGDGTPRRYPVMHSGQHLTGTIRSYELCGIVNQSVDSIDELRLSTGDDRYVIKVQIYGQNLFPDE